MPELPDVTVYLDALHRRVVGHVLERFRVLSPFVLRTFDPPATAVEGRTLVALHRIGKRIVFDFGDELFLVIHLMIAGRLKWIETGAKPPGKITLATFQFDSGTIAFTEAGAKRRASIHVVSGAANLADFDAGGIDPLDITLDRFTEQVRSERHTLKRTLTDPRLFSGIGNAYSDEILHRARLSPVQLSTNLDDAEIATLYNATQQILLEWIERLRKEAGDGWPEKVTAFRKEMAVHGRFGLPCPVCDTPVQHIVYADNETNYCATCQTGGRLLADRGLSRLLGSDWPKSLEEMEERRKR
jgi:formamidopyrimidine-DNA glycosylase